MPEASGRVASCPRCSGTDPTVCTCVRDCGFPGCWEVPQPGRPASSGWTQDQSLWPAHLRDDAPFATCTACGRHTWDVTGFGYECRLPQPNGKPCTGTLIAPDGSAE